MCDGVVSEKLNLSEGILDSWLRCKSLGVSYSVKAAPIIVTKKDGLDEMLEKNSDLLNCAELTIHQAKGTLFDLKRLLFITDRNGLNLEVVGDPRTLGEGEEIGLIPGSDWREIVSGSNAVGTALATGGVSQVNGYEHYCEGFKPWSCTAACINDPYDNQQVGVVDLSGLSDTHDRIHLSLVTSWATGIQSQLQQLITNRWASIDRAVMANSKFSSKGEFILLDKQGRVVRSSPDALGILVEYFPDFQSNNKFRVNTEKYGGEKASANSISFEGPIDGGIQTIVNPQNPGEVLGFKINLTTTVKKASVGREKAKLSLEVEGSQKIMSSSVRDYKKMSLAAKAPIPILLQGETGTGKDFLAKAIHAESKNSDGPFIDINCGAFSKELLNGELFGYVEGAFTGAKKGGMLGKIEAADKGTLFLDEVAEMPLAIQPVFLRVLQEKEIYRIGEVKPRKVEFKLIVATNVNLKQAVREGRFRKDLFYRISGIVYKLRSLSERKDEMPVLVENLLNQIAQEHKIERKYIANSLLEKLVEMRWEGNIRELSNTLEYMVFMSEHKTLGIDDLPEDYVSNQFSDNVEVSHKVEPVLMNNESLNLEEIERAAIKKTIENFGGNITKTACALGIAKSTLYLKIKKFDL